MVLVLAVVRFLLLQCWSPVGNCSRRSKSARMRAWYSSQAVDMHWRETNIPMVMATGSWLCFLLIAYFHHQVEGKTHEICIGEGTSQVQRSKAFPTLSTFFF